MNAGMELSEFMLFHISQVPWSQTVALHFDNSIVGIILSNSITAIIPHSFQFITTMFCHCLEHTHRRCHHSLVHCSAGIARQVVAWHHEEGVLSFLE